MTAWSRDLALGLRAAWQTRRWVDGDRLALLMQDGGASPGGERDPSRALAACRLAIRVLARVPGVAVRNTCLYRSVGECLVLRRLGHASRVDIGVRQAGDAQVDAHAWRSGEQVSEHDFTLLTFPSDREPARSK